MRTEPILAVLRYRPKHSKVSMTLKAEGGLRFISGNRKPYFSLTKTEHRAGFPNQCQSFGCDHEAILKHWPKFADLAALHSSDIDGVPMHAEANGWYDLAGALPGNAGEQYHVGNSQRHFPKPEGAPRRGSWDNTDYRTPTEDEALAIFADHVRISVDEARVVRDEVVRIWKDTRQHCECGEDRGVFVPHNLAYTQKSWTAARAWFANWVEEQKPRWKAEADACIAKHGLKVFGDKWPIE